MRYKVCLIIVAAVLSIGLIGCGQITKDLTDDSAKNTTGGVNQDQETVISERTVNISTSMVRAGTIKPQCVTGPDSITLAEGKSELLSFLVDCQDTTTPGLIRIELRGYLDEDGLVGQDNPTSILPVKVDCSNGTIELNKNTVVLQTWTAPFAASSLSTTVDMNVSGDWTNAGNQAYSGKLHLKLVKVFTPDGVETDKFIWHQVIPTPFPRRWGFSAIEFKDRLYIIGGNKGPTSGDLVNDIWYSDENGNNWTQVLVPTGNYVINNNGAVVFQNKIWLLGPNGVHNSSDAIKWDKMTNQAVAPFNPLVFNNKLMTIENDTVWESENGKDWNSFSISALQNLEKGNVLPNQAAVYKDKLFILTNGKLLYSTDAHTWQILKTDMRGELLTVYDDKLCFFERFAEKGVVGMKVLQSTDGKNWSSLVINGDNYNVLLSYSVFTKFHDRLYAFWSDIDNMGNNYHSEVWYIDPS
ncbi:MAG: hypothetical protein DKM50_09180 [Candidatus Margulisiibacteriota bacterium]|nr:MAG: hypothetical protein DKM50_09180 [Candidatus Margulisiibacteriota bacterium]